MEPANLGFQPGERASDNLPSLVRIGAAMLDATAVTDVSGRSISRHPAFPMAVAPVKVLSGWTFPGIQVPMIVKSHNPILLGPTLSMPREQFQDRCHAGQKERVTDRQQHLCMHAWVHGRPLGDSATSVNKGSREGSSTARWLMCRRPSQER